MILCRHANSEYNKAFEDNWKIDQSDEASLKIMTTESLRDCALSPIGVKQCEFAAHFAH